MADPGRQRTPACRGDLVKLVALLETGIAELVLPGAPGASPAAVSAVFRSSKRHQLCCGGRADQPLCAGERLGCVMRFLHVLTMRREADMLLLPAEVCMAVTDFTAFGDADGSMCVAAAARGFNDDKTPVLQWAFPRRSLAAATSTSLPHTGREWGPARIVALPGVDGTKQLALFHWSSTAKRVGGALRAPTLENPRAHLPPYLQHHFSDEECMRFMTVAASADGVYVAAALRAIVDTAHPRVFVYSSADGKLLRCFGSFADVADHLPDCGADPASTRSGFGDLCFVRNGDAVDLVAVLDWSASRVFVFHAVLGSLKHVIDVSAFYKAPLRVTSMAGTDAGELCIVVRDRRSINVFDVSTGMHLGALRIGAAAMACAVPHICRMHGDAAAYDTTWAEISFVASCGSYVFACVPSGSAVFGFSPR
jgi:hypothetical protein